MLALAGVLVLYVDLRARARAARRIEAWAKRKGYHLFEVRRRWFYWGYGSYAYDIVVTDRDGRQHAGRARLAAWPTDGDGVKVDLGPVRRRPDPSGPSESW